MIIKSHDGIIVALKKGGFAISLFVFVARNMHAAIFF